MPHLTERPRVAPAAASNARARLPRVAYASEHWLPARVARRLIQRNGARVGGLRALAQRDRTSTVRDGEVHVLDAWRWLYWTTVIENVERWGAVRILPTRGAA